MTAAGPARGRHVRGVVGRGGYGAVARDRDRAGGAVGCASRLLMSAADCPAEEALAIGLCEKVCAPDGLLDDARELIGQMASIAPFGVRLAKTARRRSSLMGFEAAVDAEFGVQHLAMATEDHCNAIAAFAEKRPPSYENR